MAENNQDSGEKTLDPTQRKINQALEKGQVAKSQEMTTWIMIMGSSLVVLFIMPVLLSGMKDQFVIWLGQAHTFSLTGKADSTAFSSHTLIWFTLLTLLPLSFMMLAGIIGNLIQHPLIFSLESLKPQLSRISPLSGFKRLFSIESLLNFAKGLIKICLIAIILTFVLWPDRHLIESLVSMPLEALPDFIHRYISLIFISTLIAFALIAISDFFYQRHKWWDNLKMTHQEMKDEFKETDGNPEIKRRIREIRMGRVKQQLAATIPMATVVITNPTHFAVALKFETGMEAPELVGKGVDLMAQHIKSLARDNRVPIVENKTLARALYSTVDVGQTILPEHYKAVARILSHIISIKDRINQNKQARF